jgi:photosystem II stability/assembly factor-like uncharacterized protein
MRRTATILFLTAGLVHTSGAASWVQVNTGLTGIPAGVNSVVVDPKTPSTLYALTVNPGLPSASSTNGLFKSTDGAASWKPLANAGVVITLAIDPGNPSTLYAGTDKGVFKSADAGETWKDVTNNLSPGSVNRLVIDPKNPSTLYAVTTTVDANFVPGVPAIEAVSKTTDGGATWSTLNTGLPSNAYITVLAIDPNTPSTLYTFAPISGPPVAGPPGPGGLLKSVDGGQTWKTLSGIQTIIVSLLVIDPGNSSNIYAFTTSGLQKSTDGGETWNPFSSDLPPGTNITMLVIDRANPSSVYATTSSFGPNGPTFGIYQSVDGGSHFTALKFPFSSNSLVTSLVLDPSDPLGIYLTSAGSLPIGPLPVASSAGAGIFKTTDGGVTWNMANTGLVTYDVRSLSASGNSLYAGGYGGVSTSADGLTWNPTGLTKYTGALFASPLNPNAAYAITGRAFGCDSSESVLFATADGGGTWSNTASPLNSGCILNVTFPTAHNVPMAIDRTDANTLYLGESDDQDGYSAVLVSRDGGADWNAAWDWFNGLRGTVLALAADPSRSGTVYAGIDDGVRLGPPLLPGSGGLFRSTDAGANWSNTGLTSSAVTQLATDPSNSGIVYAAVEGHYTSPSGIQGLFKSTDSGATWTAINTGLSAVLGLKSTTATALVVDPANSTILYLGTSNAGVFRSTDAGANWSSLNDGLQSLQIRSLAISSGLYAATPAGVSRYSP